MDRSALAHNDLHRPRTPPLLTWHANAHEQRQRAAVSPDSGVAREYGVAGEYGGSGLAEAFLERVELRPQRGRQLLAEGGEPLLDLRQLLAPLLGVDREAGGEVVGGHVEPVGVERVRRRDVTDRRLVRGGRALDPLDGPLEHAAVLAEPRPDELALVVAAEPVDVENPRQLPGGRAPAHLDPVAGRRPRVLA